LLGVEQGYLADLLQVVLDRVRGGTGHRGLRGRKIVVVTEDGDPLVLAGAVRGQLDHAGSRPAGDHGLGVRGRLATLGVLGVPGSVRYFRPAGVAGQIVGHLAGIAEVGLDQVLLGQRGLQVGVAGVEIAKVAGIRVLQIRVSIETRLAGVHRDQAAAGGGAQPRTVLIRVPGTRTVWPRSRLIPDGPRALVRGPGAIPLALGHLPAVTLRAAPGFALPGITPAHPPRLLDRQPRQRHSQPQARPSPGPGHLRCLHNADGSGKAELAGPGVHAGPEPFIVHLRVAIGRDLAGRPGGLYGGGPAPSEHAAGEPYHDPPAVAEPGRVRGIRTADQVIGDRERHRSVPRLHEAHSAHFAGEIHRGGRVPTDSPSAAVLADVLVIADEDHGADPGVPRPRQAGDLLPRRRAAVRSLPRVLQPDDRQDGIAAEEAESRIGQAVAEVRIVLPRAGLVHERDRDRQCPHCPGLWWHPGRVISSHPRSITPAEPVRLGTARRD